MKKVRVLKIEEREDAQHPHNKEVGYFKERFMIGDPLVGQEFLLYMENGIPIWHTSFVTEILSTDTFKTKNSIYQISEII